MNVSEDTRQAYLKYSIHELRFSNDFATVENNKIIFKSYYNKTTFDINDIKKITLKKVRNYSNNIIALVIGLVIIETMFIKIDLTLRLLLAVSSLLFIFFSIFHKKQNYTLLVATNKTVVKIIVDKKQKNEAKYLMGRINKYLKNKNK
jgi:hypothetical protein